MPYEVLWDPRVPQALRSLAAPERKRVVNRILSLGDDPLPAGARQLRSSPVSFKLDDGRFVLLYIVDSAAHTVTVYAVLKDGELLNAREYRVDA